MIDRLEQHEQNVERWKSELEAAGWVEVRMTMWRTPDGRLYRGPYGAWKRMKAETDGAA